MINFLIDTSVWIEALKKNGSDKAKERVKKCIDEESAVITGVIMMELLGGTITKKKYDDLKLDLDTLEYLESSKDVWDKASEISFELKRKGVNVPGTDIFIAAISIAYDCVLIHMDKHFELIGKYTELKHIKLE
ncbi:MAG: PIN domain-containing protein [Candidatus Eremiobacterota bacterium]